MFSNNIQEGSTVYLVKLIPEQDEPILISEHVVTKLLATRMYVNGISSHFHFPGGGMAGNGWSTYLTEYKPNAPLTMKHSSV